MQKKLWSINALSNELGHDRRSLSKWLEGLPPEKVDGRVKYYLLSDVLEHLGRDGKLREEKRTTSQSPGEYNPIRSMVEEGVKHFVYFFGDESLNFWLALMKEKGFEPLQALELYRYLSFMIYLKCEEFLTGDHFNKGLKEDNDRGWGLDELACKTFENIIQSKPPKEEEFEIQVPERIQELMTLGEQKFMQKYKIESNFN